MDFQPAAMQSYILAGRRFNMAYKATQYTTGTTIVDMCYDSFAPEILPGSQKHAIVKQQLKIPTLDPDNIDSYRPISNISFISEMIEHVVAVRFNEHCESN